MTPAGSPTARIRLSTPSASFGSITQTRPFAPSACEAIRSPGFSGENQPKPQSVSSTNRVSAIRSSVAPPALSDLGVARPRVRRADRDDLRAFRPSFESSRHGVVDAQGVPLLQLDHLVLHLRAKAAADDDVHLFLVLVLVAERNPEVRLDPL